MEIDTRQAERQNVDAEWVDDESEKIAAYAESEKIAAYAESEKLGAYAESEKLGVSAEWLYDQSETLDAYVEDMERLFELELNAIEAEIKAAKRALRGSNLPMAEKLAEKREVSNMEGRRDKLKLEFFERRASIRAKVDAMLDIYTKGA